MTTYLQIFPFPYAIAFAQLAVGLPYAFPLWIFGIREMPSLSFGDVITLLPIAILNAGGHLCAVIAMFTPGGGSFTHVIKASEPVVSVILGLLINGVVPKPLTALSLLPITYGVAYASTLGNLNVATMSKELTTMAAKMAMASNVAFALRSIVRKNLKPDFKVRTKLNNPANEHAVTTMLSALITIPVLLYFEGIPQLESAYEGLKDKQGFVINVVICGLSYYLYNEMQNIVLGSLGAVPTAVGNTLKRVVIFVALFLFTTGETFPVPKIVGCAIAVVGCLAFAIFDSKKM